MEPKGEKIAIPSSSGEEEPNKQERNEKGTISNQVEKEDELDNFYDVENQTQKDPNTPLPPTSLEDKATTNLADATLTTEHSETTSSSLVPTRSPRARESTPGAVAVAGIHSHLYEAASSDDISASTDSPGNPTTADPNHPIIEATLVDAETGRDSPLPTTEGHVIDTKKWRNRAIVVAVLTILTIVGLVTGLVRSNNRDDDNDEGSLVPSDPLFFESLEELQVAVTAYLNDPTETATVARTYGFPINTWQVERVTDFSSLFSANRVGADLVRDFNEPLNLWNTSNATNFASIFEGCISFNQRLEWDTALVVNMTHAFRNCHEFEGQGLETWRTGSVQFFRGTFESATSFFADLSQWNVSRAVNTEAMFRGAAKFDSDLQFWDVSSVVSMTSMFRGSAFSHDISSWQIGLVESFESMFKDTPYNLSLCAWGPPLQQRYSEDQQSRAADTTNMFLNTSCPNPEDPIIRQDPAGPFCYDCTGDYDGDGGGTGPVPLPPVNDVCTGAVEVTWTPRPDIHPSFLLYSFGGVTLLANPDIISGCTPDPPTPGVWFSVVGTGDILEAVTCFGSSFDTWISVGSGPSCSNVTCVAFADGGCASSQTGSAIAWPSVANETYYIHVSGANSSSLGTFSLVVTSYDEVLLPFAN